MDELNGGVTWLRFFAVVAAASCHEVELLSAVKVKNDNVHFKASPEACLVSHELDGIMNFSRTIPLSLSSIVQRPRLILEDQRQL